MRPEAPTVHLDEPDLELYLRERLPESTISAMDSHLAECTACGQRLVQAIGSLTLSTVAQDGTSIEDEKRKEPRYNTDEVVTLQALNPLSTDRHHGHLTDVSRSGMKLQTGARAESGTLIKISLKNVIAFGEVRYCVKMGDAFHLGVQLSQVVHVSTPCVSR